MKGKDNEGKAFTRLLFTLMKDRETKLREDGEKYDEEWKTTVCVHK
jgi:hypothetical protein